MRIGVFDSGIGGLAIANRLEQLLPEMEILRAHDHEHMPYGLRSEREIRELTEQAIQPLLDAQCRCIVLACNTATAAAVEFLRQRYLDTSFIGLEPMVKLAAQLTRTGRIIVCATDSTLRSARYAALKQRWASDVEVLEPPCSDWASRIEAGEADDLDVSNVTELVLKTGADVVVLACTHYHWIATRLQQLLGDSAQVLEPSSAIAAQLGRIVAATESKSSP